MRIQLRHNISKRKGGSMKLSRKKIIITVVISVLLVLGVLILPRIYNIINVADEKKILFVMSIDEDMYFEGRNEGGHEFEPYFFYYGVKYNEEGPELIKLGDTTYYADDPDAEDIVQWMKKWNYR